MKGKRLFKVINTNASFRGSVAADRVGQND